MTDSSSDLPDIKLELTDHFFEDTQGFPEEVMDALYNILAQLVHNPDNPDIEPEISSTGEYSCQFTRGYFVYWRVKRENLLGSEPDLMYTRPVSVVVLKVRGVLVSET